MSESHAEQPRVAAVDEELLIIAELASDLLFSLLQPHLQIVSIEGINLPG